MLKAGATIACPECHVPQVRSTKDIGPGGQVNDGQWESLGFDMTANQPMKCFKCGESFSRYNFETKKDELYFEGEGWIPLSDVAPSKPLEKKPKDKPLIIVPNSRFLM